MSTLKLKHSGGNSMSIEAPATNPASNLALKLPATIGSANQILKNSGTAGTLEWSTLIEDSSGNVGIGTTSLNYPSGGGLTIYNATTPRLKLCNNDSGTGSSDGAEISFHNSTKDLYIENRESEDIVFYSGSERMRINSGGSFLFNTTSTTIDSSNPGFVLSQESSNSVFLKHGREANGTHSTAEFYGNQGQFRINGDGDVQNTNNSYGQISDETLKQDIVDASSQWDDIKAVKVRKFRFKSNPTGDLQIGVVAQELEKVSPKLVTEVATSSDDLTSTETVKSVKYSVLYMKAIKCLQEAMAKIETLETKVAALEAG